MRIPDLDNAWNFLFITFVIFGVVIGRYLLVAGIFYLVFYSWFPQKWKARKINERPHKPGQYRREMGWSLLTASLFALSGSGLLWLWQHGYTRVYLSLKDYPAWWLPLSLLISLFIHETYYYWLHRWMHRPAVFKLVHKVHHDSNITSPWTAFSFHPLEGLLQALFLPLLMLVLPMHLYIVLIQLTIMTLSSVINHLDIEVYPKGVAGRVMGRLLIGATHHSLHHKQFRYNYGLYFTFWDKWKGTESPLYRSLYREKSGNNKPKGGIY
jgi:lathosterol oxidase